MKTNFIKLLILVLTLFSVNFNQIKSQDITNFTQLNTPEDDFAATYRSTCKGNEIWLTTSRPGFVKGSRKIVYFKRQQGKQPIMMDAPYPINQNTDKGVNSKYMDGVPTFSSCDPLYGVFVSNRLDSGKSYDNDLYEMVYNGQEWKVRRLDELNSEFWDDTPSLSSDGRFLYFASDRLRPGVGASSIFISQKLPDGKWSSSEPLELDGYDIQTPYANADGFLYYSVDKDGRKDFDIWRVKLDNITGKPIKGTEESLPIKGINQKNTIEGHPIISPSGSWLIFSSNNTKNNDKDLFYCLLEDKSDTIKVKQIFRTFTFDSTFMEYVDASLTYDGVVEITDLVSGKTFKAFKKDSDYSYISIPSNQEANPIDDSRIASIIVKSNVSSIKHLSMTDTLYYDKGRNCNFNHDLTIWDIDVLENPKCEQNFSIINIPFFLTSYWCPTTKKYKNYTPCQSILADDNDCVSLNPLEKPCQDNDLWEYKLIPASIERIKQSGLCIPQKELDQFAIIWSKEVDDAITTFIDNMSTALQKPCIKRSIKSNKPITIEVIGWTDPRAIDNSCLFTGRDINFNNTFVKLSGLASKEEYISGGLLKKGTPFTRSGFGGNQLLSDLRAYCTAVMLDSLWTEKVVKYKELKEIGLIEVVAVGKSINPENLARERQRSVNVVIYTSVPAEPLVPGKSSELGRSLALCASRDCLSNLLCIELENTLPDDNDYLAQRVMNVATEDIVKKETFNQTKQNLSSLNNDSNLFHLQIITTTSEKEARDILGKLVNNNINNLELSTYTNKLGIVYYRVRSGIYKDLKDARNEANIIKNILANYGINIIIDYILIENNNK